MTPGSTPLSQSEQGRAFLQHRVGRFGQVGAGIGWGFLVFRVLQALFTGNLHAIATPDVAFHFAAGLALFCVWLVCRGPARSARTIRAIESTGLVVASACYSAMGAALPMVARPDFIVLLAITYGLFARAVYVPSSARRTLAVSIAVAIPALASGYWTALQMDPEKWAPLIPELHSAGRHQVAAVLTIFMAAWWVCTIVTCTAASNVIYGLRREARSARKLGQYTLETKLGSGGMGTVYRASHAMLRRPTAVKLLQADKVGEQSLARFEREVQLTASLTHPNTITVFDYGRTPDDVFYYAMELLDGPTLAEVVEHDGPQPAARVAHILQQVAGALAEAHAVGLIHRDIKPANIMLVQQGGEHDVAKVLDFGLVKEIDPNSEDVGLTRDQALMGTPLYMSPEAIKAPETVDARSDLYSLGAVGYFLLTGTPVFRGDSVVEVCSAHLHTAPEPPSERLGQELPTDLEDTILACLEKEPHARPRTALELRARLLACPACRGWSETDASTWWQTCGCELEARVSDATTPGSAQTLDVDFARRAGAEPRD